MKESSQNNMLCSNFTQGLNQGLYTNTSCIVIDFLKPTSQKANWRDVYRYKEGDVGLGMVIFSMYAHKMSRTLGIVIYALLCCGTALAQCPDEATDLLSWTSQIVSIFSSFFLFFTFFLHFTAQIKEISNIISNSLIIALHRHACIFFSFV